MLTIEVSGMDVVQRQLEGLSGEAMARVMSPALNKVAAKAKTEITRGITQGFAVKAAEVRSSIDVRRASQGNLEAVLTVFGSTKRRGRSLNLIHFLAAMQAGGRAYKLRGARIGKKDMAQLERQLGYVIKKGGGLKRIDGSFVGNNGRTVFRRVPGKQMASRPGRLTKHSQAIEPAQVIGYAQMFNSRRISQRVIERVQREIPVEVERALRLLLERGA